MKKVFEEIINASQGRHSDGVLYAGAVGVIGVKLLLLQGVLPLVFVIPPGRLIHSQPFCNIFDSIALFIVYS